ncbi:MAG TPA: TetR/AcrR family transcriptional regulator [Bauldia sp.]|jgi:AcrR family transcriptional regulator
MRPALPPARAKAKIPSQERGKLRVASLLKAAEGVIAERGYDAATMTEIAGRAGASIGSLYQYFPTKPAVVDTLRARLWDALHADLKELSASASGSTAQELGRDLVALLRGFYRRRPALASIAEARRLPATVASDVRNRLRKEIVNVLCAYAPRMPPDRAETAAVVIYQLMKAAAGLDDEPRLRHREAAFTELAAMAEIYLLRLAPSLPDTRQRQPAEA